MNYAAAVDVILMHSECRGDVPLDEALFPEGFLGCLRPFTGLREENFLQVMDAIIAVQPHLAGQREWDVRLVAGLWALVVSARCWGLDPGGMLQRNCLISAADAQRLRLWVTCIDLAVRRLMRGGDPAEALDYYRERPTHTEPGAEADRGV